MTVLMLFIQRYFRGPRVSEAVLRSGIIAFYVWAGSWLHLHWPQVSHNLTVSLKNIIYPLLVYIVFGWLLLSVAMSFLLGLFGMSGSSSSRGLGSFFLAAIARLSKIAIMTLVNATIFIIRVGVAAVTPGNVLQTCADAGTHFVERQADMLIRPMR